MAFWDWVKWGLHAFQVFCGSIFLFHLRMSLVKILSLVIAIMPILMIWDGVVGSPEALEMVQYSLMAWNMVESGLAL